jgi:hypothetical protein
MIHGTHLVDIDTIPIYSSANLVSSSLHTAAPAPDSAKLDVGRPLRVSRQSCQYLGFRYLHPIAMRVHLSKSTGRLISCNECSRNFHKIFGVVWGSPVKQSADRLRRSTAWTLSVIRCEICLRPGVWVCFATLMLTPPAPRKYLYFNANCAAGARSNVPLYSLRRDMAAWAYAQTMKVKMCYVNA